jgi:tartrate-resistant acid phosphatase type 5
MKDCVAVWILGDVIYEEGVKSVDDPQFQTKFEQPYKDINLPFYILYGNHDYIGCEECYITYSQRSDKWHMPARYYKQGIDKVISFYGIDTERFDHDQHEWLEDNLATDSAKWKLVLGHRPLISSEETKVKENWSGKAQLKDSTCTKADFYVAGHAHIMEDQGVVEGCSVHQLVSGGGGAYTRKVVESATGEFYAERNGFLSISVNNKELSYGFYNDEGQQLFEKKITK